MYDYPSKKELATLKKWDFRAKGVEGFLSLVKQLWWNSDWGVVLGKISRLELHTGGWSGNESIIQSLENNLLFWGLTWRVARVGGHYYFNLKTLRRVYGKYHCNSQRNQQDKGK